MAATAASTFPALAAARRPNIVVVYCDDLGYGDLGCYGHPAMKTPNLDRMAAEGTRFTQFYSAAPVCTPSRASLMTGRYPMRVGLPRVLMPGANTGINASETTVAEVLRSEGYSTKCIGKWHLGDKPEYLPTRHGFDSYFGIPYSNDMSPTPGPGAPGRKEDPPLPLIRDDRTVETEPDQTRLTQRYTDEAVRFIREQKAKPFFLYYAQTFPHVPLYASSRFRGKSAAGLYGDVVEEIDWSVGELLKAIRASGQEKDTLVLFSSDNGPWRVKREYAGTAGHLSYGKGTTWEGGMRVPGIARWVGRVPAGRVSSSFLTTMDMLPTFANFAGAKTPAGLKLDGEDVSAVLTGADGRERLFFYWMQDDLRAVRRGRWKLNWKITGEWGFDNAVKILDKPLLFDLENDPGEHWDQAAGHPELVRELMDLLRAHEQELKPA
jgi:arylsulfatase